MKAGTKNQPNGSWKQFFSNKTADKARAVCVRRLQPSVCECVEGYWHNGTECVLFNCDMCDSSKNEICVDGKKCEFSCTTCSGFIEIK